MSKKASSITSRNSDSNALNGLKKRPSHLICNWLPLSSFHHQFLESMVPVALAVICLVAAWKGKEGGSTPLESLINRFRRRAEPAPLREAITSYAQKEKQSQQKSSFPKPASDPPERGWN